MPACQTAIRWTACHLCGEKHSCAETLDGWECWPCHHGPDGGYPDRRVPHAQRSSNAERLL